MITLDSSRFAAARFPRARAARALVLAMGTALLLAGCGKNPAPASSAPASTAKPAASTPAASTPAALPAAAGTAAHAAQAQATAQAQAKLASMSVNDLLAAARTAYAQHRLVAPAGDNAMEYYEAVLAKDPANQVAKDALRETFPFGVPDVEKAISANNFDEANREIAVLAKADPTNYTLTLLRSKLDAQQKLQARQQQAAQQKQQRAQQAAQLAATQKATAEKAAAKAAAEKTAAAQAVAARAAPAPKPAAAAPAPKPAGVTRDVQVISAAPAQYPVAAARNQTSGFALVQFTVTADGKVTGAHVLASSPRHVFDDAAIRAVEQSKYRPAMKDGQVVSAVLQRRIDFNFGG